MAAERYDVVVVGAGLGGLTAAAYLAKAGRRVLVLEHHTVPGGYAHDFRRGRYRFEVSLHAMDGVAPGGWSYTPLRELGVLDQVTFNRLDPFYTVRFPEHEVTAHADPMAYEAELARHFPHEARGIRSLFDAMTAVFFETRRFMADGERDARPPVEQMPSVYPNMLAAMGSSWADFMAEHIGDSRLQAVFSALWEYYGLPPSRLNAATFILPWASYHLFGAFYPEGGSMAVSRAIEATIKQHGGELRYAQTVTNIEVHAGRVATVETAKGLRVEADAVVSNASAPTTMLDMIGREHLPDGYVRRLEQAKPALSNLVVYLGLERDLTAEGWSHHELFLADSYDLEAAYRNIVDGRFENADLVVTHYGHADPTCAPEGGSVLVLFTLAPWNHREQWGTAGDLDGYRTNPAYLAAKDAAGEKLLARLEPHLPGVRDAVKYMEIATPLTNVRYSLNPEGSIYGSEQSVENMYMGRLGAVTPIENLFLTGAWVFAGGQSAALLSGRDTARMVLSQMAGERLVSMTSPDPTAPVEDLATTAPIAVAPDGAEIPTVTLTAAGSGRDVSLRGGGVPGVLIFHGQNTATASGPVNEAVRKRYPLATNVMTASVVDLSAVPRLFRKVADRAMRKVYDEVSAALPEGLPPEAYVVILPDWDGSVTQAVGLRDVDKTAGIAVLDRDGKLVGVHQGDGLSDAALAMLARAGA